MGKSSRKKQHATPKKRPSETQISGALIDLAAPIYDPDMPLEAYQSLISLTVAAWNISLFPKEQRKQQLQSFLKSGSHLQLTFDEILAANSAEEVTAEPHLGMNAVELIKALTHRKDRLFPNDWRFVVNYDVSLKDGQPYVSVSYVPLPADALPASKADT